MGGQENNTKKPENLATTNFGQWFCMIFLRCGMPGRVEFINFCCLGTSCHENIDNGNL
jgi:hypothetical protein